MADKLRDKQKLEALEARWVGVGSEETTSSEWKNNVNREAANAFIGHPRLLQFQSIGLGQCRERTRIQLLEQMIRHVKPPPPGKTEGPRVDGTGNFVRRKSVNKDAAGRN